MKELLEKLVPIVKKGLEDEHNQVREVSIMVVGSFVEFLQPEILQYHEQLLPEVKK
jgi:vesicle coat complex subunit